LTPADASFDPSTRLRAGPSTRLKAGGPGNGAELFTDLYELTMLQAYFNEAMHEEAVFDLFIRGLPPERNFLVAAGLQQVLEYLEDLNFSAESLVYLETLKLFSDDFLEYLSDLHFTGQVRAIPEGTVVFADEPLLEVAAPMPQAQLIETYLLNQITFQTLIASKGARAVLAARGKTLVDFGSRRAHGSDAALKAARALYLAGYDSTSNVLAGERYGIPVAGTMAHSYIQAHDTEAEAFQEFVRSFPDTVLLIDTYDTVEGVRRAIETARAMGRPNIRAVRLDSGDLFELSTTARRILDSAGFKDIGVFASGGLDELEINRLLAAGAPIDAFGVGTSAVVSSDAPALDSVYKLVSYAGRPRIKLSTGKVTLPGRKQVFRRSRNGRFEEDEIALANERLEGEPLLVEVMRDGRRTSEGLAMLLGARERTKSQLAGLPPEIGNLEPALTLYPVKRSRALALELEQLRQSVAD
jgi:nicotinate phosphoribosyltransferase